MAQQLMVLSKTKVKTLARTAVLKNSASEFIKLAGEIGADRDTTDWYFERIDNMINHELIVGLSIVLFDDDCPTHGLRLSIDWDKHKAECTRQNMITFDEDDGDIHASTSEIMDLLKDYLNKRRQETNDARFEIWYTQNEAAKRRLGIIPYFRLLKRQPITKSERREYDERWAVIDAARRARAQRETTAADLQETKLNAW